MADCFVVTWAGDTRLLVQRISAVDGGICLARVLVSKLSAHFNKLPEVKLHDSEPISVFEDDIVYSCDVITLSEFVHGPHPLGKSHGRLMYHAGVNRVFAIDHSDFSLTMGDIRNDTFYIPRCNEFLLFVNGVVDAINQIFGKKGSIARTSGVPCSHGMWSSVLSQLSLEDGEKKTKKGTKSGYIHAMNRANQVKIINSKLCGRKEAEERLREAQNVFVATLDKSIGRAFAATGKCKFGSSCKFKHEETIMSKGEGGTAGLPSSAGNAKTHECFSWRDTGKCKFGDACHYRHGEGDSRTAT
jgi:hypothetical protein